MRNRLFLQAGCLVCLVCGVLAAADPSFTHRQQAILAEMEGFRPQGVQTRGVWMLGEWDTDQGLEKLVSVPASRDNAASLFVLLDDAYRSEAALLENGGEESRGVRILLEAAEMGTCRLTPDYYPDFDAVDARQPDMNMYRRYLQALLRRAEQASARGDTAHAEHCYRAALLCGRHLTNDKSSSVVYVTGLIFKIRAAQGMAGFYLRAGQRDRAALAKEYADALAIVMRAFVWKANVALGETTLFACLPATRRVALEDAESFWRKEAVVRLATLRYGVADSAGAVVKRNPVFEKLADDTLAAVFAADPDPSVRRFALWAVKNATPENYSSLRHDFSFEE